MLVHVAVPAPALPLLTYRVPPALPCPVRGARVLVPLGRRMVTGCVTAVFDDDAGADLSPAVSVKDVTDVLDVEPFLPEATLDLALWVAEYYMASPGDAVSAAMPPLAWLESERRYQLATSARTDVTAESAGMATDAVQHRVLEQLRDGAVRTTRALAGRTPDLPAVEAAVRALERRGAIERVLAIRGRRSAFRTRLAAAITAAGLEIVEAASAAPAGWAMAGGGLRLGGKQVSALEALAGTPAGLPVAALRDRGIDTPTVRRLAARGLVSLTEQRHERDPFGAEAPAAIAPHSLTGEQAEAAATLSGFLDEGGFKAAVLHGVTGSGKTEVYLRLAAHARELGRQTLVLVPEIALTPQVVLRFRGAFGDRVAIQHSGLGDGERHDQWHRIRRGEADVVVGTRSAVFAPLNRLGLAIVDEEHDTSYKQEESPRYQGRDVAVVRAQRAGALVVLGSATPSLETYENAERGRYARVVLTRRVLDRPLATVRIVDLREEYAEVGPEVVLSRALQAGIASRLEAGEQTLLLLNRRGFATAVFCRQCGHTLECPNCSVSLTVHTRGQGPSRGVCHYCNYSTRVPGTCVKCAAPYLEQMGFGTERVQAEVERLFQRIRVGRVDRDTMQRRGAIQQMLAAFGAGEIDLLVGTQMIAKGHDFPRVTLVGVVSADMGLGLADFRAGERTFQLLTQVAGRAGRGERAGEAIIQTIHPEHYSIRLACRQDYSAFFAEERVYRRTLRYPPSVAMINVVVRGRSLAEALGGAADIVARLRPAAAGCFAILGPAPAPLARLRGEYRAQFFLKGSSRAVMRAALAGALGPPGDRRKITVDVDPVGML